MKFIHELIDKTYTKQVSKNGISKLDWLRLRVVFILNTIFILFLLAPIYVSVVGGNFIATLLTLTIVIILASSGILILKGYWQLPIYIIAIVPSFIGFIIAYFNLAPYQSMVTQFCLSLILSMWLIPSKRVRIYYSIAYFVILFHLSYINSPLSDTITFMILILGYIIIFHILIFFMESQDGQLSTSLEAQKNMNASLKNKNNQLKTFSHIMSHDLKAPLGTIRSFSQLIKKDSKFVNEKQVKYFDFIENSTDQMKSLIDELMVYHKVESENVELNTTDINSVIDSIKEIHQYDIEENRIKIISSDLPKIKGNDTLLKTLFGNLISNSLKFQPKEKEGHIPKIEIWYTDDNKDSIDVFIADNGIGINENYIPNLFQPFKRFQSRQEYEGSGLGMSICKSVMDKHLGSINLYKSSENGTTFKLSFPKETTDNNI